MNPFLAILLGSFVLCYAAIAVVIARRPLIGRIAVREAVRRPAQTAVLVLGLMIAGAAIFSIQVIFDTMYETNRAQVLQTWGRDDIEISGGGTYFDPSLARRLAAAPQSCSCIAAFQNAIVTTGSVVDIDRSVGRQNVQITGLDLNAGQRFGSFVLADGRSTHGFELASGGIFLTQPLADALGAKSGDRLRVIAGGSSNHEVTVAGIVRREGAGAYGFDRSMFAALSTAQLLTGNDRVNAIRVSGRGEGDVEVANGHAAASAMQRLLAAEGSNLRVLEVKSAALDIVVKAAQNGRPFVTSFGVIIALAATALVANLVLMLAEERRPRLAVLRAMGLTRTGLVQLSLTEGAIYSLLGGIAGVPAGLALGFILVRGPDVFGPTGPHLVFSLHIESLLGAVAAAALINLVTVFLASLRITRMAISSAIRDLPEPSVRKASSPKWLALLVVLGVAGVIAMVSGHSDYALLGGGLIIAAAAGLLKGRLSDRLRLSIAGAAAALWAYLAFESSVNLNSPGTVFFALLVSVVALSVLIATNLSLLDRAIGWAGHMSPGLRATLRPTVAYASRRPLRSGLVIAAFSIVMALLVLVESLLATALQAYPVESGGWDVQAVVAGTDKLSAPSSLQSEIGRVETFPSRTFFGPVNWKYTTFQGTTGWHQEPVTVFGLSSQQLESGMGFGKASDWAAIARDPHAIAAAAAVGSVVELATSNGTVRYRVAATIQAANGGITSSVVPGLIGSREAMALLSDSAPGAMMLLTPAPGVSADALSRDLQRALLSEGADVSTTKSLLDQDAAANRGLADFLILLMRIGLLVGVSSLGAVALRAVIERRRSIGMLRAIGYQPAQVLIGLLVEMAVVATAGLAVGLIIAFAMGEKFVAILGGGAHFSPDYGGIAFTAGLVYAAVLVVTLLPAIRASRLRPAEALRSVA